jgi:hypothetical protein
MNLTPVFHQYLRHAALSTLELTFADARGTVSYRSKADEPAFAMPVRAGGKGHWQIIRPATGWQTMQAPVAKDQFEVATDLYYINVDRNQAKSGTRSEIREGGKTRSLSPPCK